MAQKRPRMVVVGSSYVDMAIKCEAFPKAGGMVSGSGFSCDCAGAGLNQAVVAANCGCDVSFVGKVGSGNFGVMIKELLMDKGISVDLMETANAKNTGVVVTLVNSTGENMSVVSGGANLAIHAERIESVKIEQAISTADVCLIDGTLPQDIVESAVKMAEMRNTKSVLAISMDSPNADGEVEMLPDGFRGVDVLIPEFANGENTKDGLFASGNDFKMIGAGLVTQGFNCVVVNTCKKGCFVFERGDVEHVKGYEVEYLDRTCCQDAFAGALAASIAAGDNILKAVKFANAAFAITGSKFGGIDVMPQKEDILKLLFEMED